VDALWVADSKERVPALTLRRILPFSGDFLAFLNLRLAIFAVLEIRSFS
jgi:hypothetical protein